MIIPFDILLVFFGASTLLALAPGPDNIFVLTQSILKGPQAGIIITLGLCTGLTFHTTAVALGVATLFQTSEVAFTTLKLLGAAYLLFLAWKTFTAPAISLASGSNQTGSALRLYRRGIIMNITNPKVSIFFLAFLPQFATPERGSVVLQIFLLGLVFIFSALLIFSLVSLLSGTIGNLLKQAPATQGLLNWLAGIVFVGLAAKIAFARR